MSCLSYMDVVGWPMNELVNVDLTEIEKDEAPDATFDFIIYQLGEGIGQKLQAAFGGTQIKIPSETNALTDNHPLMIALGAVDAEELVEEVGGDFFYATRDSSPIQGQGRGSRSERSR